MTFIFQQKAYHIEKANIWNNLIQNIVSNFDWMNVICQGDLYGYVCTQYTMESFYPQNAFFNHQKIEDMIFEPLFILYHHSFYHKVKSYSSRMHRKEKWNLLKSTKPTP